VKTKVSRKGRRPFAALARYASEFELPPDARAGAVDPDAELTALVSDLAAPSLDSALMRAPEMRRLSRASTLAALTLTIAALFAVALAEWNASVSISSGGRSVVGAVAQVRTGGEPDLPGGPSGTTPSGGPQGETGSAGPAGTSPSAGPQGYTGSAGPP
jgi:hypothetical protein